MWSRKNGILVGLLALQLGLVGWQHRPQPAASTIARAQLFEDLALDDVLGLTIEDGSETVDLRKEDDGWVVQSAHGYAADGAKVEQTVRELLALEVADVVSTSGKFQRQLKVADDDFSKRARLLTKAGTKTVLVGTPGRAGSTHLRRADSQDVVAVRDFSSWKLGTGPAAWLDTALFEAKQGDIAELLLEREGQRLLLQRAGDGWLVDGAPADGAAVDKLLAKARRITLSDVLGPAEDGSSPTLVVTVGLGAETPESAAPAGEEPESASSAAPPTPDPVSSRTTLRFAAREGGYAATRDGGSHAVQVAAWAIDPLVQASAAELRAQ